MDNDGEEGQPFHKGDQLTFKKYFPRDGVWKVEVNGRTFRVKIIVEDPKESREKKASPPTSPVKPLSPRAFVAIPFSMSRKVVANLMQLATRPFRETVFVRRPKQKHPMPIPETTRKILEAETKSLNKVLKELQLELTIIMQAYSQYFNVDPAKEDARLLVKAKPNDLLFMKMIENPYSIMPKPTELITVPPAPQPPEEISEDDENEADNDPDEDDEDEIVSSDSDDESARDDEQTDDDEEDTNNRMKSNIVKDENIMSQSLPGSLPSMTITPPVVVVGKFSETGVPKSPKKEKDKIEKKDEKIEKKDLKTTKDEKRDKKERDETKKEDRKEEKKDTDKKDSDKKDDKKEDKIDKEKKEKIKNSDKEKDEKKKTKQSKDKKVSQSREKPERKSIEDKNGEKKPEESDDDEDEASSPKKADEKVLAHFPSGVNFLPSTSTTSPSPIGNSPHSPSNSTSSNNTATTTNSLVPIATSADLREVGALAGSRPFLYVSLLSMPQYLNPNSLPKSIVEQMESLEFDIFPLKDNDDEDLVVLLVMQMFFKLGLVSEFKIPEITLYRFLKTVSLRYRFVPFHNFYHAFNVTQTLYYFLVGCGCASVLNPLELLAMMIAALCHDCDHPGLNNAFQAKANTRIALLHKKSTLENHHLLQCMYIISQPQCDILSNLSQGQKDAILVYVRHLILATDLALHGPIHRRLLERRKAITKKLSIGKELVDEDRLLIMCCLVKCADLSNEIRPTKIAQKWAMMVMQEFFAQSDKERELALPVTPFMDKHRVIIAKEQMNFIDNLCMPLYDHLVDIFPNLQQCVRQLATNRQEWQKRVQSYYSDNPSGMKKLSNVSIWESRDKVSKGKGTNLKSLLSSHSSSSSK